MTIKEFYSRYSSDCTAGSSNQVLNRDKLPTEHTGRVAYRLSHGGENYALLFSNQIDSTYADGSISVANDIGGTWKILSMRVGLCRAWDDEPKEWHNVTFEGYASKTVVGPEPFCTDPIPLHAKAGDYLCYEVTIFGACFPYHTEMVLNVRKKNADGIFVMDKRIPVPLMIGSDRPVTKKVAFIGDSITQGCGTEYESYTHWASVIADGLPADMSVWDLGIGYARGYDAATDKGWLARAKQCDVVNVCFGVNDILKGRTAEEVKADLRTIVHALKAAGCEVVLLTVPPFDIQGIAQKYWYDVNAAIRGELGMEADKIFDFAAVVGKPAPEEHMAKYCPHPNAEGCALTAKAYLEQKILG